MVSSAPFTTADRQTARRRRGRSRLRHRARAVAHGSGARPARPDRPQRARVDELEAADRRPALRLLRHRPTVVRTTSTCCVRGRSSHWTSLSRCGALGGNLQATLLLLTLMAICTALRPRHHRLAARGVRTAADAVDGVRGDDGLLRGDRVRLHADPDRPAAAFLGVHRTSDVHAGDRAVLDAALHGRGKFPVRHACPSREAAARSWVPVGIAIALVAHRRRCLPIDARRHASRPDSPFARSWSSRLPARWPCCSACAFRLACG